MNALGVKTPIFHVGSVFAARGGAIVVDGATVVGLQRDTSAATLVVAVFRAVHANQEWRDRLGHGCGDLPAWVGVQLALIKRDSEVFATDTTIVANAVLGHVKKRAVIVRVDDNLK